MLAAGLLALLLAGALVRLAAWSRRDPDLAAAARLLEALLAADAARLLLTLLVLAPAREAGLVPYSGGARLAFHASQACVLAWPFGVAALTWHLLTRLRPVAWVAPLWLAAVGVLAALYPDLRGERLLDAYRACQVGGVGFALLALLGQRPDHFEVGRAHLVSLLLVAGLAAELAGPFFAGDAVAWWWTAQASWTAFLAACALSAWVRRPPWRISPSSPAR